MNELLAPSWAVRPPLDSRNTQYRFEENEYVQFLDGVETESVRNPNAGDENLQTGSLGHVDLDSNLLRQSISAIDSMSANDAYSRYNLTVDPRYPGRWTQIVLGNFSGDAGYGLSLEYPGRFRWTEEATKVPRIRDLIETTFQCEFLKNIRLFCASNAIIVSHRDYLEFNRGFRRLHIPLRTNGNCVNLEGRYAYHMNVAEIHFLNGREPHGGGNLAIGETRLHLVLDFDPDVPIAALFVSPERQLSYVAAARIARPEPSESELERIVDGFAAIMAPSTYATVVLGANLLPFMYEFDAAAVYDLIIEAAVRSDQPVLLAQARADRTFFMGT